MFSNWPCSVERGVKEEKLEREETDTRGRKGKGGGMTGLLSAWLHVYMSKLLHMHLSTEICNLS